MSCPAVISPKSAPVSLADAIAEVLVLARTDAGGRCLWCQSAELNVSVDDAVSSEVTVVCRRCGSELSGHVASIAEELCA
jgi:hypothetical protein